VISFNAGEIYEMAIQIERNGAEFYRKAAAAAANDQTGSVLSGLAEMEVDHEQTFKQMKAQLSEQQLATTSFDPDGEAAAYLQASVDGKVFDTASRPAEVLTGTESLEEVLGTAIGLEKDSIVFYTGMKEVVPEGAGRDRLDDIIKQEMGHITTLCKELAKLS